jgi:fructose-1,6-bisphosphatase/sedoheptulose 1,7-bisphosphatase-like protein
MRISYSTVTKTFQVLGERERDQAPELWVGWV